MGLSRLLLLLAGAALLSAAPLGDEIDRKYPLEGPLKVLAEDIKSTSYRTLVLEKMLVTDLAAEWQRVETNDNPETFLKKHGGKDRVLGDADLRRAYERRLQIRADFLDLMRAGYKRYKQVAPFDKGVQAEVFATTLKKGTTPAAGLRALSISPEAESQWPALRGAFGQGHALHADLPLEWDQKGAHIRWRVKVPGMGNSSPIVWGERIFLTSADDKGQERSVLCFNRADGKLLWSAQAPSRPPEAGVRDKNGYASATSVTDGQRVISFLGSCGLVCHDFSGKQLWHHDLPAVRTMHGIASSPVLYKDLVILLQDQTQADSVFLALDRKTGQLAWQGKRARGHSWSTPTLIHVGERDELLFAGMDRVRGYDPSTGRELWALSGPTNEVIPMIVVGKGLVYSASGRNGPTLALRPGGEGDVTQESTVWRTTRSGPHVPSPILVGDMLYTFNDTGVVHCLNAQTGELVWQERINDSFSASPLAAGDRIYISGESGVTYVLKAGPSLDILARNDLGEPILASPAAIDRQIIIRTRSELILIENSVP